MTDLNFSVTLNAPEGELAMIRAQGADAGHFLQGQLTQDVLLMPAGQARLAAWCSAKGRMLATFWVFKASNEDFLLILSRDLLAATLKRLKMFVLRAKCELSDVTALYSIEGWVGDAAREPAGAMHSIAPSAISIRARGQIGNEVTLFLPDGRLADQSVSRALRIRPAQPADQADAEKISQWNALEISSGVARLSAAVSEAFVPQMLNYESAEGVNFKKGCYPGQEVVARSQFRGTLKRRGYILSGDQRMQAGQEVFDERDSAQPCGLIAQASASPQGGFIAIASLQTSAADSPGLRLGAADGALLQLHALPYALLADV